MEWAGIGLARDRLPVACRKRRLLGQRADGSCDGRDKDRHALKRCFHSSRSPYLSHLLGPFKAGSAPRKRKRLLRLQVLGTIQAVRMIHCENRPQDSPSTSISNIVRKPAIGVRAWNLSAPKASMR